MKTNKNICITINGRMSKKDSSFWQYKILVDICGGSLEWICSIHLVVYPTYIGFGGNNSN